MCAGSMPGVNLTPATCSIRFCHAKPRDVPSPGQCAQANQTRNLLNRCLLPLQTCASMDPVAQGLSTLWDTAYTMACPCTACLVSPLLQFLALQQRHFPPAADSSSQNLFFLMNQVKTSSAQVFSRLGPSDAAPDLQVFTTP